MADRIIPYADRKDAIRDVLIGWARARRRGSYSELGKAVGIPARGPWQSVLNSITQEEKNKGYPDITYLVYNKLTGYPSQIDFKPAKPPTDEQKSMADKIIEDVFKHYS